MTNMFRRLLLLTVFLPVAAFAQDVDPAKYAQPPIPSLLPAQASAPVSPGSTVPASSAAAVSPQTTEAVTATAAAPIADGEIVSPTPQLVSTETVKKKESLFFTPNQLVSIMRANQGFIAPREAFDKTNQSDKPLDSGPRVITLSAIIYNGKNDWTVWLNGEKVTPKNIPDRIMGITVKPDRVHLRWMDIGNQRIVNITLRPNQQYLLDSDTIVLGSQ